MDSIVETAKRPRVQLAAGLIAGGLALVLVVALVATGGGLPSQPRPQVQGGIAAPEVRQAPWKIETFPVRYRTPMKKKDRTALKDQRPRLRKTLRELYGTMFLKPGRMNQVIRSSFAEPAAKEYRRSKAGLPKNAHDVRILARRARIGIDAVSARRAAANVVVRARGASGKKTFGIEHHASLWLEREKGHWRVIAFEIDQGPLTKVKKDAGKDSDGRDRKARNDRRKDGRHDARKDRKRRKGKG